jgi:hypothetical protein
VFPVMSANLTLPDYGWFARDTTKCVSAAPTTCSAASFSIDNYSHRRRYCDLRM